MLTYEQQESAYLSLIQKLKDYDFDTDIDVCIEEWDSHRGVKGFPHNYNLDIKYKYYEKSSIDLIFNLDDEGQWSKVEIMNLDIDSKYQRTGLGRRLIEITVALSKEIGVTKIYGHALDNEYNSSVGFYEKCGFEIKKDETVTRFYKLLGE